MRAVRTCWEGAPMTDPRKRPTPFAMMPAEAFLDHRLTAIQLRVLGALYTWRDKDTGVAKVYREQIASRCGYDVAVVSRATRDLVRLGWVEKSDGRGRGVLTSYRIWPPRAAAENVTHAVRFYQGENLTGSHVKPDGFASKNLTGSHVKHDRPGQPLQKQTIQKLQTRAREAGNPGRAKAFESMGAVAAGEIARMQERLKR